MESGWLDRNEFKPYHIANKMIEGRKKIAVSFTSTAIPKNTPEITILTETCLSKTPPVIFLFKSFGSKIKRDKSTNVIIRGSSCKFLNGHMAGIIAKDASENIAIFLFP